MKLLKQKQQCNMEVNTLEIKKKTYVDDMDRGVYDVKNEDRFDFKADKGLTKEIVETISNEKDEPE